MKKIILKFIAYIFSQYIILFTYFFLISDGNWHWGNLGNKQDIFFAIWMLFSLPVIEIILLIVPTIIALRKQGIKRLYILFLAFVLEFFICWFMTNQEIETWMIVKSTLSVILFIVFFRKQLHIFYH
ncbi:MAG: hypothetical protein EPN37_07930 [Chitinophagaceae bacterium]|nr:MAG: hypothetical protein EPN37_07930 [Chitinophagaceae bacterium]